MKTVDQWIEKGYEHFAQVGPVNFSVKKLSEEINIPRTTFNYHFISKEDFFSELLNYHLDIVEKFAAQGKNEVKVYIPDLFISLSNFPISLRFHRQLFKHRNSPEFDRVYRLGNDISTDAFVLDRYTEYYQLQVSGEEAKNIHNIFLDAWYSRLEVDDLTPDSMIRISEDIMRSMEPVLKRSGN